MAKRDKEFWETAEDWSRRKHLILSYYLKPAAAKLGTITSDRNVFVLDAFAGRGKYANDVPGSPILLGQLADKCASWSNPVNLRVLNIEPDDENYQELTHCTSEWEAKGKITNLQGTFQQHLSTVLQHIGHSPLVAFLDPFRPSHLLFDDFLPLLRRTATTELLFVFHTPAVIRMLLAASPRSRNSEKGRKTLSEKLTQVFGHEHWHDLLRQDVITADAVVECFNRGLTDHASGNVWIGSTAINARYKVGLKYHIVFLTRNMHGVSLMNEAFVVETRTAFSEDPANSQLALALVDKTDPAAMAESEKVERLERTLEEIGIQSPDKVWMRSGLCFELLTRHFGEFLEKEHRQAVDRMIHRPSLPRIQPLDAHQFSTGRWRTNDKTKLKFVL